MLLFREAHLGILLIVLSTLTVYAMIVGYFSVKDDAGPSSNPNGTDFAGFGQLEADTILDSIEKLSELARDVTRLKMQGSIARSKLRRLMGLGANAKVVKPITETFP